MACSCNITSRPSAKTPQAELPLPQSNLMRRIYTFCEPLTDYAHETADLWKQSWAKHGWSPRVLTSADFKDHPLRARLRARVQTLPTVNGREWETTAYLRYLAFESKAPGVFGDFDVMNYGIKPEHLKRIPEDGDPQIYAYSIAGLPNPGLWVANQAGIRAMLIDFMHGEVPLDKINGKPHTSDMYYFFRNAKKHSKNICPNAGLGDWKTAPAVHWHNSAIAVRFGRNPVDRAKVIREIRPI